MRCGIVQLRLDLCQEGIKAQSGMAFPFMGSFSAISLEVLIRRIARKKEEYFLEKKYLPK